MRFIFGGGGVKKTLANVDGVVENTNKFLLFVSILLLVAVAVWSIRIILQKRRKTKLYQVLLLFHQIQSDLALHKASGARDGSAVSVETVATLKKLLKDRFFLKKLGESAHKSLMRSMELLEDGRLDLSSQIALVDQWLRIINP